MGLTPIDIHHKEFKSARFGGYNEEDVDSFLDHVADEFERLIQETSEMKAQMEHQRTRLCEFEEMQTSLQSALLAATKSAEAVREQARQESEAIIAKAQEEADSMVRSAQEQARQMTLMAQNERQKLVRDFTRLKEIKGRYLDSIREIADFNLAQVADIEARERAEGGVDETAFSSEVPVAPANIEPPPLVDRTADAVPEAAGDPEAPPPVEAVAAPGGMPAPSPVQPSDPAVDVVPTPLVDAFTEGPIPEVTPSPVSVQMAEARLTEPVAAAAVGVASAAIATEEAPVGEVRSQPAPPSSNLVDEVLAMDNGGDIYEDISDDDEENGDKGRKGRKQKREKHFFWE